MIIYPELSGNDVVIVERLILHSKIFGSEKFGGLVRKIVLAGENFGRLSIMYIEENLADKTLTK